MTELLAIIRDQLVELLPRLPRLGRTLARHEADADDLVQVALERALTRADQWDPASRFDSWMFAIVRNAWIDEVRARQRRGGHLDVDELAEVVGEDATNSEIEVMSVQTAMARLPEEQRIAVSLVL